MTAGNEQRISYYLISPEDEEELTANAIAGAKERLGAEEEEDEDMFGDDDEDGEVAATRKRKREAAKEAQIEKSVLQKKQEAEKVLAEKYEKRRRTGEVAPDSVPTDDPEEGLQIPDEVRSMCASERRQRRKLTFSLSGSDQLQNRPRLQHWRTRCDHGFEAIHPVARQWRRLACPIKLRAQLEI